MWQAAASLMILIKTPEKKCRDGNGVLRTVAKKIALSYPS
jgi:hypothetical protein